MIRPKAKYSQPAGVFRPTLDWRYFVCAVMAMVFIVFTSLSQVAFADESEADKFASEGKEYVEQYEKTDKNGEVDPVRTIESTRSDWHNKNSFGYVFSRVFKAGYLNETDLNTQGKDPINCNVDSKYAGTPLYHNCDVPNMFTEIRQDLASIFLPSYMVRGGEKKSNLLSYPAFGMPSNLPNGGASAKPENRTTKYTALELFGYNLQYTDYYGEWDHIDIMTGARAMSNFGFGERAAVFSKAVFNAVGAGIAEGGSRAWASLKDGDILGAIGGIYSGFVTGATTAFANTYLDTSDQNVFDTWAWYRVGYGRTLYNARELTNAEVLENAQNLLIKAIQESLPEEAQTPDDLKAGASGPGELSEAVPLCRIRESKSGDLSDFRKGEQITKEQCETEANARAKSSIEPNKFSAEFDYQPEGVSKEQTLAQWKEQNKKYLDLIEKYNLNLEVGDDESAKKDIMQSIRDGWEEAYKKAVLDQIMSAQKDNAFKWIRNILNVQLATKAFKEDPKNNFNAPWNRFICLDENGKDMEDSDGAKVLVYDHEGNLNPACKPIRAPIQNGFYGNGYTSGKAPANDTRYMMRGAVLNAIMGDSGLANSMINAANFTTRASNTMMSLAFSPLLSTLGLDTMVIGFIETFRDSVFFPIVLIAFMVLGAQVLWRGLRGSLKETLVNAATGVGIFMVGVVLMYSPQWTIKLVDEYPAMVERAIAGYLFSTGNYPGDELCTTGKTDSQPTGDTVEGLKGEKLSFDPNAGTRSMMCENWRTFVFNPWVYGQFGTNYVNLYAADSGQSKTLKNTNSDLVGDAEVPMGGGTSINNWALYQVQVTSYDTPTNSDPDNVSVGLSPDFFRIVDAQAGPNNGEGTDPTYFGHWSGQEGSRFGTSAVALGVSILGAFTVISYALAKIQVSFMVMVMLLIMPIMFIMGVVRGQSRLKFKSYMATVAGLVLQRIMYVLLLAVMFRILVGMGTMSTHYYTTAVCSAVTCIIFLSYRKEFDQLIMSAVGEGVGAPTMQDLTSNPRAAMEGAGIKVPTAISNYYRGAKSRVIGGTSGAVGGLITGGINGVKRGMREGAQADRAREYNRQRTQGFSVLQAAGTAKRQGEQSAKREHVADDDYKQMLSDLEAIENERDEAEMLQSERDYDAIVRSGVDKLIDNSPVAKAERRAHDVNIYGDDLKPKDMRRVKRLTKKRKKAQQRFDKQVMNRPRDTLKGEIGNYMRGVKDNRERDKIENERRNAEVERAIRDEEFIQGELEDMADKRSKRLRRRVRAQEISRQRQILRKTREQLEPQRAEDRQ